jgi:hypothetical protein
MVKVAVRELVAVLAVTDHVTVPEPVALAGEQVSQVVALLVAVQAQVEAEAVTETFPLVAP